MEKYFLKRANLEFLKKLWKISVMEFIVTKLKGHSHAF